MLFLPKNTAYLPHRMHYCRSVPSSGWVLASSGEDDHGGGYFVLGFEVEELDALGAAAGGADGFGADADDLAELADDHELAGLVDEVDAGTTPTLGCLQDRIPKMGIPQK
jgi:hypothetical protein